MLNPLSITIGRPVIKLIYKVKKGIFTAIIGTIAL